MSIARVVLMVDCVVALSSCNALTELAEPTYAEIRFTHRDTRIEMVNIVKAYGAEGCEQAAEDFIKGFLQGSGSGWVQTDKTCKKELDELYQKIFNDEQIHATYMKIGGGWGHEARAVLYGIPSSQAQAVCEKVAAEMEKNLGTDVKCVQGTVG